MEETGIQFKELWSWFQSRQPPLMAAHSSEPRVAAKLVPFPVAGQTDSIPQPPRSRTGHGDELWAVECGGGVELARKKG